MNVQGTETAPIYFTDKRDDSVGGDAGEDGTATSPGPDWWRGMQIQNTGSAVMEHCVVSYAGAAERAGIYMRSSGSLSLSNAMMANNEGAGLRVNSGYSAVTSTENTFRDNTYGVRVGINASWTDTSSLFTGNTYDVFLDGGTITGEVTWKLNPVYDFFIGDLHSIVVGETGILNIQPGSVFKFEQFQALYVDGQLNALGTEIAPIYFTDKRDDSVGGDAGEDGSATSPGPDWWRGIQIQNNGSAVLDHCVVAYAGMAERAGVYMRSVAGSLTLTHSILHKTKGAGLLVEPVAGVHTIQGNIFTMNDTGVEVRKGTASITLRDNQILGNAAYGVANINSEILDARENWWGDASGPYHPILNALGTGNAVTDGVLFEPWRTGPNNEGETEGETPTEGEGENPAIHFADGNEDSRIVMSEAIAYLAGWQQGNNPMAYAIRAAYIWQGGEYYTYDPESAPPLCWVLTGPKALKHGAATGGAGTAVRVINGNRLLITVTPVQGTLVWGVEQPLPEGMPLEEVTGANGEWDEVNHKVTWWGAGDTPVVLAFKAVGLSDASVLNGLASFDGVLAIISNPEEQHVDTPVVLTGLGEDDSVVTADTTSEDGVVATIETRTDLQPLDSPGLILEETSPALGTPENAVADGTVPATEISASAVDAAPRCGGWSCECSKNGIFRGYLTDWLLVGLGLMVLFDLAGARPVL